MKDTRLTRFINFIGTPMALIIALLVFTVLGPISVYIDKLYLKYRKDKPRTHPLWALGGHKNDFEDRYYFVRDIRENN